MYKGHEFVKFISKVGYVLRLCVSKLLHFTLGRINDKND